MGNTWTAITISITLKYYFETDHKSKPKSRNYENSRIGKFFTSGLAKISWATHEVITNIYTVYLLIWCLWEGHNIIFWWYSWQKWITWIIRKHQIKQCLKLRDILQNNRPIVFKKLRSKKEQRKLRFLL